MFVCIGVCFVWQPTIELAQAMPRDFCDMANEALCIYAAQVESRVTFFFFTNLKKKTGQPNFEILTLKKKTGQPRGAP